MISAEQVRATVADLLGAAVTTVERVPGSVANQDFAVNLVDGARFVLKAGPSAKIAAEAWTCQRLTVLGVPVPEVVAVDLDPTRLGLSFLIMTFVEGTPSADGEVARDAGKWFRQVHAEELSGWGPLVVAADHHWHLPRPRSLSVVPGSDRGRAIRPSRARLGRCLGRAAGRRGARPGQRRGNTELPGARSAAAQRPQTGPPFGVTTADAVSSRPSSTGVTPRSVILRPISPDCRCPVPP